MDETEECVICHQPNYQMLMLTCVHDPCINCAVEHYSRESNGKVRYNVYTCAICGYVTPLDISSVVELYKMLPFQRRLPVQMLNRKKNSHPIMPQQPLIQQPVYRQDPPLPPKPLAMSSGNLPPINHQIQHDLSNSDDVDLLREIYSVSAQLHKKHYASNPMSLRNGCRDHEEEEVTYYCFSCLCTICPECAIHGNHTGHPVKQIKKAINYVKNQFLQTAEKITRASNHFKNSKELYTKMMSDLNELYGRHRKSVTYYFNTIKKYIEKKYQYLLLKLDQTHQNNLHLVRQKIYGLTEEKAEADSITKSLLSVLKKDDLVVLDEYGKKAEDFKLKLSKYEIYPEIYGKVEGLKTVNHSQLRDFTSEIAYLVTKLDFRWADLKLSELQLRGVIEQS